MIGTFTLRPQSIVSTIYGFHVPERVLAQLLPAVIENSATLQLAAAGQHEHQLHLGSSNGDAVLAVSERERGDIMPDCYVLADQAAFEWQGPLFATLTVTAPPVDSTERDRMRRITTAKQLELKRHQTSLMDTNKPATRSSKSTTPIVKRARIESTTTTTTTTTTAAAVTATPDSTALLNALALAPLSRRFVSETFPHASGAQLTELAEFKGNAWHLRFDKFDLVDPNHPAFLADDAKRRQVLARIHQSRQIRGLTVQGTTATTSATPAKRNNTTTTGAKPTEYQKLWLQHNQLHAELEQRRMRFASMATMYFDKSTLSFQPDIDVAAATQQLDREEREFRDKLAQYNQLIAQLVVLERQPQQQPPPQ